MSVSEASNAEFSRPRMFQDRFGNVSFNIFKVWMPTCFVYMTITTIRSGIKLIYRREYEYSTYVLWSIIHLATIFFFVRRRKKILDIVRKLEKILEEAGDVDRVWSKFKVTVWLGVLYGVLTFALRLSLVSNKNHAQFVRHAFGVSDDATMRPLTFLYVCLTCLNFASEFASSVCWPLLYSFLAQLISATVVSLNDSLVESNVSTETSLATVVSRAREELNEIRLSVDGANRLLRVAVLFWYVLSLCGGYAGLTYFLSSGDESFLELLYTMIFSQFYIQPLALTVYVTLVASGIPTALERTGLLVHRWSEVASLGGRTSQLLSLQSLIKTPPVGLSLGGFCLISREFLGSFLGLATSYAVVIFQLNVGFSRRSNSSAGNFTAM